MKNGVSVRQEPGWVEPDQPGFVLYVEGPQDRGVIEAWASRTSRPLGRAVARATVILGGRQPARAVDHFRTVRARHGISRGLCILDRDDTPWTGSLFEPGTDLQVFTWRRRHIESYLLVPPAIQRSLGLAADDLRLQQFFETELPPLDDEDAMRALDAKALFARRGSLAMLLGRYVRPTRVARVMYPHEIHRDVRAVLRWVRGDVPRKGARS